MRRLIAIMGCWQHWARIRAVRGTWLPDAKGLYDVRFFVGRPPYTNKMVCPHGNSDIVPLDVDDGYAGLPAKVQAMCAWAADAGYDYVTKIDDDCYVAPKILDRSIVADHDYVGRFRRPSAGYPASYASGFCYHLSKYAMEVLAGSNLTPDWAEDRWVGNTLNFHGVMGWSDVGSYAPVHPPILPHNIFRTNLKYAAVFCEFPEPKLMLEMHREHGKLMAVTSQLPEPIPVQAVRNVPVSIEDLMRPPTDSIETQAGFKRTR